MIFFAGRLKGQFYQARDDRCAHQYVEDPIGRAVIPKTQQPNTDPKDSGVHHAKYGRVGNAFVSIYGHGMPPGRLIGGKVSGGRGRLTYLKKMFNGG